METNKHIYILTTVRNNIKHILQPLAVLQAYGTTQKYHKPLALGNIVIK